jgi:glutathione S-transferase
MTEPLLRLFGRSSSHFTRVVRVFAAELGVQYQLCVVHDLLSLDPADYGHNPALKLPVLQQSGASWFGALNICRVLARAAERDARLVWPEDATVPLLVNAQELVLQGMATDVTLVMSKVGGAGAASEHRSKLTTSLSNVLAWLETNVEAVLAGLPAERSLSYLEVTLFCFVTHLAFREIAPLEPYPKLRAFAERYGERASARSTSYRFDR